MKRDTINTDVRQLSGKWNGPRAKRTTEDLSVAEEREHIAGVIQHSGDAGVEVETETGRFTSGLKPLDVVEKSVIGRTLPDEAVEHHAQSGRVSRYAVIDFVCREDPW